MINCPECNNLISDKAAACPTCGCPIAVRQSPPIMNGSPWQQTPSMTNTVPLQTAPQFGQQHSSLYPQIKAYSDGVNTIYTLSIIGLILCLGIGFIFAIINISKINKLVPVEGPIDNPYDLAEYQTAERKLKTAQTFSSITLIAAGVAIIVGFLIGVFSQI